jgi:cephalosporin hydroxylase
MSQENGEEAVVRAFRERYRDSGVWIWTTWLGTQVLKIPSDLWVYQELLSRTKPDVIVETGTWRGGSALYLASICDLLGKGKVITVDIEERDDRPTHPRITYLTGSSVDDEVVARIRAEIGPDDTVMAILDSDHAKEHVLAELRAYGPLVSDGCYLIVEDTVTSEDEWAPDADPLAAVNEFLVENQAFSVDKTCEKFLFTGHPGGYLRRGARVGPRRQPGGPKRPPARAAPPGRAGRFLRAVFRRGSPKAAGLSE